MTRIIAIIFCFLLMMFGCKNANNNPDSIEKHYLIAKSVLVEDLIEKIPELKSYSELMVNSLQMKPPVLKMQESDIKDINQRKAQDIAIANADFLRDVYHPETGSALRNEIMSIRLASDQDMPQGTDSQLQNCYRVLMYNYYYNSSVTAIVDIVKGSVINIKRVIDAEAESNTRIENIATDIALNSKQVIEALKLKGENIEENKKNLKISINKTKCERSKHLCIGPTFYNESSDRVVWTIVDMTDWKLIGLAWAETSESSGKITEMEVQNEYIMSHFCDVNNDTMLGNWKLNYRLVGSDGIELFDVSYKGKPVINSSKIVDWHVSYLNKQGVGYSDATGCPMFSAAAVVAFNDPYVEKLKDTQGKDAGYAFVQDFRSPIWPAMCNYRYQSRFEFYDDGKFRIMGVNHGKGCNDSAVYKPVFRIDLNLGGKAESFAEWNGSGWGKWSKENWADQKKSKLSPEGYWFRYTNESGVGYYIIPDHGQYGKSGRGDNAFTYITKFKKDVDEGVTDLATIGDCCSYDYKQGPDKYLNPAENIDGSKLILWYVPRMYNDKRHGNEYCWADMIPINGKLEVKTWPGYVGPMFVPIAK